MDRDPHMEPMPSSSPDIPAEPAGRRTAATTAARAPRPYLGLAGALLLAILGIAPLDLGFTGAYIAISGHWQSAPHALLVNLVVLVGINGIGAWAILRPLRHLDARAAGLRRRARRRLGRLSLWLPLWTFVMGAVYCAAVFLSGSYTGGIGEETGVEPGTAIGAYFWFAFVYGFYFAFYGYFAVSDVLGRAAERAPPAPMARLRQPFALKLGLVAVALAVMPPALILQDLTWLAPVRAAQGLYRTDAVLLDLMATMLAAGISLFFVGRSLLRPINALVQGFDGLAAGRFDLRLPAASDDELGALSRRFNRMVRGLAERRRVEAMFGKYVAPAVARSILADSADGHIRGEAREATNLFADIEGFTALSETLPADAAIDMLNDYFAAVSAPITARGGAIVNLTGDGLHAVFNVPYPIANHAEAAVLAAIDIQRALARMRFGPDALCLRTRIGVHGGLVVAGSVGCDDRLHYTVYGDSVNVAARLEALNKDLGTETLVSETVIRSLPPGAMPRDIVVTRHPGITLRGHVRPVTVHALALPEADPDEPAGADA